MKGLKKLLSIGVVVAMLLVLAPMLVPSVALAEEDSQSANVTVSAGTSDVVLNSATLYFTTQTLTGAAMSEENKQPSTNWLLSDESGDGAGWQVQIKAASANLTNATQEDKNLAITTGTITYDQWAMKVLVSKADATTLAAVATSDPITGLNGTTGSGDGTLTNVDTSDIILVKAVAGNGMGSYEITPKFNIYLPASAYTGAYSVTLTLTTTFS